MGLNLHLDYTIHPLIALRPTHHNEEILGHVSRTPIKPNLVHLPQPPISLKTIVINPNTPTILKLFYYL